MSLLAGTTAWTAVFMSVPARNEFEAHKEKGFQPKPGAGGVPGRAAVPRAEIPVWGQLRNYWDKRAGENDKVLLIDNWKREIEGKSAHYCLPDIVC